MSLSIQGKTAIITGAGHGIGLAIARYFVARGANVMFAGADDDALQSELRSLKDADGQARSFAADMSQRLSMANLISATIDSFDRVDILVNAHRLVQPCDPLSADEDVLEKMLRQNMMAGLKLSQMVAKRMIAQSAEQEQGQAGAIVNLTTLAAQRPHPQLMAYSIACAAQDQATRALALALAPHRVRVNSVAFGSVMTAEVKAAVKEDPERRDIIVAGTPMGRIASTDELAETVHFLVSEGAGFITGQVVNVDGGRSLADPVRTAVF